jgi:nicotinate-nucleotide pyrophosphorylase (carboxylating)
MELLDKEYINSLIDIALKEDVGDGDLTTNSLISETSMAVASMTAKADGIIAGLPVARMVFEKMHADTIWTEHIKEGDRVKKGDLIVTIESTFRTLLTGERLALNFLQRMSGVASETNKYVVELDGFDTKILDTRKTLPCFRLLDKYSVKMGGGKNHRIGLFDLAMIKDNHIKVAGSIANALKQVRSTIATGIRIEVETTCLDEVAQALEAGADIIMLDNMSNEMMTEAVKMIDGKAESEASGNMSIPRLKGVAATGVDFISVGALTHSVMALDISMNIQTK